MTIDDALRGLCKCDRSDKLFGLLDACCVGIREYVTLQGLRLFGVCFSSILYLESCATVPHLSLSEKIISADIQ